MPSVKIARPKIAAPKKGLAVVRPQPKAAVTSFMPGLGSMWSSFGPAADQVARRIKVVPRSPVGYNPKLSTGENMRRGVRFFHGLEGAGIGAVEHAGTVKAGTTGRKPVLRAPRRAPVTSFMPGLGALAAVAPVRAAVVMRSPVQVTTTRYIAPPPVTYAPRQQVVALGTAQMRLVAPASGYAQQMPMLAPSPAGNGRRAASYDDTDAALYTDDQDVMDFAAEGEELGPMEDTDEAISTEDREFGGMGGLFDIQIGAGTLAVAAIAAWFLLRKRRA